MMESPVDPDSATPYDRVEYIGGTFPQTHPVRLATVAALFGLTSPPPARCRVLELGCGDGSNLIPMAFHLPGSEFVGVDLAHLPIAAGQQRLRRLNLHNIRLLQGDVSVACEQLGQFDYVIAHGLYSWVPDAVRPQILRVAAERLTECGVAYISYNALPGCRIRHLVRELVGFRFGAGTSDPAQVKQVREFLQAFARIENKSDGHFLEVLKREFEFVQEIPDYVLYHDDLAVDSKAFYLHEFAAAAQTWGLQYLGEADISEMFTMAGFAEFDAMLATWSNNDWLAREQYLDFTKGRRFRQTLLCGQAHRLSRELAAHRIGQFELRSRLRVEHENPAIFDRSEVPFRGTKRGLKIDEPLAKTALVRLGQIFPDTISFEDLLSDAIARCRAAGLTYSRAESGPALANMLWALVRADFIELLRDPQHLAPPPESPPRVSRLAADQVASGSKVTGALHTNFVLEDEFAAALVLAMDGSRDRGALLRWVGERSGAEPAVAAKRLDDLIEFLGRQGALAVEATD